LRSGSFSLFLRALKDGERIPFGDYHVRVWQVPGHCGDHLAFLVEEMDAGITGDLLFVGKVGGTMSDSDARTEWESLQRLLREWPPHATIWPGHDYGARPSSTVAWERESNPFLCCENVDAFIHLKAEWTTFKAKHGLR
jgi:hydroxyacylglutathione hydrolase